MLKKYRVKSAEEIGESEPDKDPHFVDSMYNYCNQIIEIDTEYGIPNNISIGTYDGWRWAERWLIPIDNSDSIMME